MFNSLFKLIRFYFMFIGFFVTLLLVLSLSFFASKTKIVSSIVSKDVILHMKLSGEIVDKKNSDFNVFSLLKGSSLEKKYYILDLKESFEKAARDNRVKSVFLELGHLKASYALISEFRNILKNFKSSGKKIHVWFEVADSYQYYLASVADEISSPEPGELQLIGPSFSFPYVGKALKKIGLAFDIVKVGSYKSTFEWLISNKMGPQTKDMFNSLEENIRMSLVDDISKDRKDRNLIDVHKWFKRSFYGIREAFDNKIIDDISYLHVYKKKLKDKYQADFYQFYDYLVRFQFADSNSSSAGVALIEVIGEIHDQLGLGISTEKVSFHELEEELQWARDDDNVKSVLIRVSSPGGSALASDQIWAMIDAIKQKKPVVVSMGSVAASGGYYISAPASKVFSSRMTITGSIGVVGVLPNIEKFRDLYGINFEMISGTDRKNFLNPGRSLSAMDLDILQKRTDTVYSEFLKKVSLGRNIKVENLKKIADGRVWSGSQAKKVKLVDAIGGFSEALAEAKVQGGFAKDERVKTIRWKPDILSLSDCFKSINHLKACSYSTYSSLKYYSSQDLGYKYLNKIKNIYEEVDHVKVYAL